MASKGRRLAEGSSCMSRTAWVCEQTSIGCLIIDMLIGVPLGLLCAMHNT